MNNVTALAPRRGDLTLLTLLAIWGAGVAYLAASGFLRSNYPPLIGPIVAAGILAPMLVYAASASVRGYFERLGLFWITAFHIWRIPAALTFFWYGAQGLLPETFVRNAGWGDLIAGLLALAVTFLAKTRLRYAAMHLFGFADFVSAVATGLYFTLLNDPRMGPIRDLPLALIPLWGVGISGASHLIAFDLLRRGKGM